MSAHRPHFRWLVLGLTMLVACQRERWVIGTPLGEPADAGLGLDAAAVVLCPAPDGEPEPEPEGRPPGADHRGRWRAQLTGEEAAKFAAPRIDLLLAANGVGRLLLEGASAPATALDAAHGYLCSAPSATTCTTPSGFVPGFEYALARVSARDSILSFRALLDQPWDAWCALQTPVEETVPGCDPYYDIEPSYLFASWGEACSVRRGNEWNEIDCSRLATVERRPCACTAQTCRAARGRRLDAHLRLVAPGVLEGALWFDGDSALALQFERIADAL